MKRKVAIKVLGVLAGVFIFFYGISYYECHFNAWPIVKKLCTEPNGGKASYISGEYWSCEGNICNITFKQGDSLVSYSVDLERETASLISNIPLSQTTKYEAIF